jgi:hypothetical protein
VTLDTNTLLEQSAEQVGEPAEVNAAPPGQPISFFKPPAKPLEPKPPEWKAQLGSIFHAPATPPAWEGRWPTKAEILYILDIARTQASNKLVLSLESRAPKKDGSWKVAKALSLRRSLVSSLPVAEDREILSMLIGAARDYGYGAYDSYDQLAISYSLTPILANTLMPRVVGTGRCFMPHAPDATDLSPLSWDDGDPWRFILEMKEVSRQNWALMGRFHRDVESMDVTSPLLVTSAGFLVSSDRVARLAEDASIPWIVNLRKSKSITVPTGERDEFLAELLSSPVLPALELPAELQFEEVTSRPRPCLKISRPKLRMGADHLMAELSFDYEGRTVAENTTSQGFFENSTRRYVRRDLVAEKAASTLLFELGLRFVAASWNAEAGWKLAPTKLPRVVRSLVESNWHIIAEGKVFRSPGATRTEVKSGIDWFELHGEVDYGGAKAQLPQLLQALKRGETMVTLDDGSYGLLPEEWLHRFGVVAGMGAAEDGHIRFSPGQAGLLDALLAAQPAIDCDEAFLRVRQQLDRFQVIEPAEQPRGFIGQLRGYQLDGMGWMHFLRQFSFGGCLADDMSPTKRH